MIIPGLISSVVHEQSVQTDAVRDGLTRDHGVRTAVVKQVVIVKVMCSPSRTCLREAVVFAAPLRVLEDVVGKDIVVASSRPRRSIHAAPQSNRAADILCRISAVEDGISGDRPTVGVKRPELNAPSRPDLEDNIVLDESPWRTASDVDA